jgi:hypothetical protein
MIYSPGEVLGGLAEDYGARAMDLPRPWIVDREIRWKMQGFVGGA